MNVLISVILPAYNRQDYIEECIASVQSQTCSDWEILLIDDGSTDDTLTIGRKLAQADPRIKILEGKHAGVSAARNTGLDAAQGKYVFFLDSDDVIHPCLLETLVQSLESTGAEMAGTMCESILQSNWHEVPTRLSTDLGIAKTALLEHKKTLHAVMTSPTPLGMIGGVMIRRNWIATTRFRTDLHIGEDFFFVYENLIKGAGAVFLSEKWYYNRLHDSNTSWDFNFSGFQKRFYRRQLVWESEDRFGRTQYANKQKRNAFGLFLKFLQRKTITPADQKEMRKLMKTHKAALWPALSNKRKVLFMLSVYMPITYPLLFWLLRKINI